MVGWDQFGVKAWVKVGMNMGVPGPWWNLWLSASSARTPLCPGSAAHLGTPLGFVVPEVNGGVFLLNTSCSYPMRCVCRLPWW